MLEFWFPAGSCAQTAPLTVLTDSLFGSTLVAPRLKLGTDKIANTLLFRGELSGVVQVPLGSLLLHSQYRGSTIRSGSGLGQAGAANRDDADIVLKYSAPLDSVLSFLFLHNFSLSQDSRTIGLNRLQQLGVSSGVEWKPRDGIAQLFDAVHLSVVLGGEYNEQLSIPDRGWTLMGTGNAQNLHIDDYLMSIDGSGFLTTLTNDRTNAQWNAKISMSRIVDGSSQLEVSAQYTTLQRDFYTTFQQQVLQGLTNTLAVETRLERLLRVNARFAAPIANSIDADVSGFVENWAVGRRYREAVERLPLTAVQRDVDQLRFSLSANLRAALHLHELGTAHNAAGITIDSREEANTVRERFFLTDNDFQTLRTAERQRDNVSLRTTLWWQSVWNLLAGDTARIEYSTSLLRYDTPSVLNNDDRDELTINVNTSFTHIFSHILIGTILADVRLAHLVFIKAQRSAQNNWNRIFRLVPSLLVQSGNVVLRPQFEVLANYTSFDFEDLLGTAQSFSLRQIAYRDSVTILLNTNAVLESRMIFRYFERGEFRWKEFSETPRDRNIEAFARFLCITTYSNGWQEIAPSTLTPSVQCGAGGRLYILTQTPLGSGFVRANEFVNQALAPEALVDIRFRSGTMLRCNGWLEFQFDKTALQRIVPNFLLLLSVQL